MVLILKLLWNSSVDHFSTTGGSDPRTRDLPFITSYLLVMIAVVAYIVVVLKIGPQFMAHRKPYNVKSLMQVYNLLQILMNGYIFCGATRYFFFNPRFNWVCVKYDPTDFSKEIMAFRHFAYVCALNKYLDLLDTIFFVMRKKFNQVTFLHVYHHASVAWGSFIYMNKFFASQFTIVGHVNSFVHVIMYTYYFVASLNTNLNLDSWKHYITKIQILQFWYFTVNFGITIINNSWCNLPNSWLCLVFAQNLFMTAMFSHFYWKTYIAKRTQTGSSHEVNKIKQT